MRTQPIRELAVEHLRSFLEARGLRGQALFDAVEDGREMSWIRAERDGRPTYFQVAGDSLIPLDEVGLRMMAQAAFAREPVPSAYLSDDEHRFVARRLLQLHDAHERWLATQ